MGEPGDREMEELGEKKRGSESVLKTLLASSPGDRNRDAAFVGAQLLAALRLPGHLDR